MTRHLLARATIVVLACLALAVPGPAADAGPGAEPWHQTAMVPLSTTYDTLHELECATRNRCVGLVRGSPRDSFASTTDGGESWGRRPSPSYVSSISGLACPTTNMCLAWGGREWSSPGTVGVVLVSHDGGSTWTDRQATGRVGLRYPDLDCPDPQTCLAVEKKAAGVQVRRTVDGGRSWSAAPAPPGAYFIRAVACSSASACVVLGSDPGGSAVAYTTADLGETYVARGLPEGSFRDVDCVDAFCMAVGWTSSNKRTIVATSPDDGATWATPAIPPRTFGGYSVSCGRAGACAATIDNNFEMRNIGGAWVLRTSTGGQDWTVTKPLPVGQIRYRTSLGCSGLVCVAAIKKDQETFAFRGGLRS